MANVFKRFMIGNAVLGGASVTGYTIATGMAVSDGIDQGVEIPRPINTLAILVIVCSVILAGGAWVVRRGGRLSSEEDLRPLVRDELDKAFADAMPLLVASIAESLERRIECHAREVAVAAGKHAAVRIHEMITVDIREILTDAHRKAIITGQRMQATAAGEAVGRAALRSISPQYATTSRDD